MPIDGKAHSASYHGKREDGVQCQRKASYAKLKDGIQRRVTSKAKQTTPRFLTHVKHEGSK